MVMPLQHVLLLPDGMRRYAILHKLSYRDAYTLYFKRIIEIAKYILIEKDIPELSIALLHDYNVLGNSKRVGIDDLLDAGASGIRNIGLDEDLRKNNVTIRFFGEFNSLYKIRPDYENIITECVRESTGTKKLNILCAYSGQRETERGIAKLVSSGNNTPSYQDLLSVSFSQNLVGLAITCGQHLFEGQPYTYTTTCMPFLNTYNARFATIQKLLLDITFDDLRNAIDGYDTLRKTAEKRSRSYPEDPTKHSTFFED